MRKKWMISIVAVLVVGVLGGFFYYQSNKGAETPVLATGKFLISLKERDFKTARKYLSNETNKIYSDSKLENLWEKFYGNGTITLASPETITLLDKGSAATERIQSINTDNKQASGNTVVSLIKSSFGWKIENIKVGF